MAEYFATINWVREKDEKYIDNKYSRAHKWTFDGGLVVPAASSPHVVSFPYSTEENIDPEEAFIASLSSCHMLFFLSIAAQKQNIVDTNKDKATGVMEKNCDGNIYMSKVTLRPNIKFSGDKQPAIEEIKEIHHNSYEQCFIANSVKTEVIIEVIPKNV